MKIKNAPQNAPSIVNRKCGLPGISNHAPFLHLKQPLTSRAQSIYDANPQSKKGVEHPHIHKPRSSHTTKIKRRSPIFPSPHPGPGIAAQRAKPTNPPQSESSRFPAELRPPDRACYTRSKEANLVCRGGGSGMMSMAGKGGACGWAVCG
jgi:hypothetical protein